jgi:hypothetical protein
MSITKPSLPATFGSHTKGQTRSQQIEILQKNNMTIKEFRKQQ